MCFSAPKPQVVQAKEEPGVIKASAVNQKAAEERRLRAGLSTKGLTSTILTSGLGVGSTGAKVTGISLGT